MEMHGLEDVINIVQTFSLAMQSPDFKFKYTICIDFCSIILFFLAKYMFVSLSKRYGALISFQSAITSGKSHRSSMGEFTSVDKQQIM